MKYSLLPSGARVVTVGGCGCARLPALSLPHPQPTRWQCQVEDEDEEYEKMEESCRDELSSV